MDVAHKLARILHHLIKHRCPSDASVFAQEEELHRRYALMEIMDDHSIRLRGFRRQQNRDFLPA